MADATAGAGGKLTLTEAREKIEAMGQRLRSVRDKVDEQVEVGITAAVTVAGAGAAGVLDGWSGPEGFKIANVDGKLLGGIAFHGFAMMSGSRYASQFRSFGNGMLSAFVYRKGMDWGQRMKKNKDEGKPIFSGNEAPAQIGQGQPSGYGYGSGLVVRDAAE